MKTNRQVTLDLAGIMNEASLHAYLSQSFRFPEYYGANWDAFDECIVTIPTPGQITIRHYDELLKRVPRGAKLLKNCLEDLAKNSVGNVKIEFLPTRRSRVLLTRGTPPAGQESRRSSQSPDR